MTPSVALSRSALARDDRRILAAHLDDERPRDLARRVVADQVHADVFRSGEHDAVDVRIVDELLAGRAAAAGDEVEDAGRNAGVDHYFEQLVSEQRRCRRRLEDDGVAGDERATRGSGGERQRKVERRDHRPHAVRPQHARVLFVRSERAERQSRSRDAASTWSQ